jgi:hypothetical protein
MYCPSCSTHASDGAKFCKACGMNLNVVTQALNGGVVVSDPLRDREFKRARKQISDGINGSAIGAGLLVAAALPYFLAPRTPWIYTGTLLLALAGIVKLFRSVAKMVDAKVGGKLLDPALQPRGGTGALNNQALPGNTNSSHRVGETGKSGQQAHTRPVAFDSDPSGIPVPPDPLADNFGRPLTGRINREHSSPLRAFDKDDDLMSKLRN